MLSLQRSIQVEARPVRQSRSFRHVAPPSSRPLFRRIPYAKRVVDGVAAMAAATEEQPYGTITGDAPPESYITLVRARVDTPVLIRPTTRACRTVS